jgi:hypothetical protein
MEGRGREVLAVAVLFFALTWLTVSLRVYVRGLMLKTWGKDDTAMLVTLASLPATPAKSTLKDHRLSTNSSSSFLPSISLARLSQQYLELASIDGTFEMKMRG